MGSSENACTLFNGIAPNTSLGVGIGDGVSVGEGEAVAAMVSVAVGNRDSVASGVAVDVGTAACDLHDVITNKSTTMRSVLRFIVGLCTLSRTPKA